MRETNTAQYRTRGTKRKGKQDWSKQSRVKTSPATIGGKGGLRLGGLESVQRGGSGDEVGGGYVC